MRITLLLMLVTSISVCMHDGKPYGIAATQGQRRSMEDAHYVEIKERYAFFGLYDGHGGDIVANYAAEHLHTHCDLTALTFDTSDASLDEQVMKNLKEGFIKTHEALDNELFDVKWTGTTAIAALIYCNRLVVANAGDSRAVLSRAGKAVALSEDHKPDRDDEKKRIEAAGGRVTRTCSEDVWRVNEYIAVSRALGDKNCNPFVIPDPEIKQELLGADDEFLILACDGVWDVMENQEAIDIVKKALEDKPNDYANAAVVLQNEALNKESDDNISVIIAEIKLSK